MIPPHLFTGCYAPLYVCVGVRPHLCLLIGRVIASAAVQREGVALPLAMLSHVTLKKGSPIRLEPAHMTPGQESKEASFHN